MNQAVTMLDDRAVYVTPSGEIQVDVRIDSETVWLTQQQIADLFDVSRQNVNFHVANIYREEELDPRATCKESLQVRTEGRRTVRRKIDLYSLDAILSVGYRVNSKTAASFRQWATRILRDRLIRDHRQRQAEQLQWQHLHQIASHVENREEAQALLNVIDRYAKSWRMLQQYDEIASRPAQLSRRDAVRS